jgi:hypothetical protein
MQTEQKDDSELIKETHDRDFSRRQVTCGRQHQKQDINNNMM